VVSSNIEAVGYDQDAKKLRVKFKKGSTYEYDDVPFSEYEAMMDAESVGSYFASHIKDRYTTRKV
jgi:hypothetical protein